MKFTLIYDGDLPASGNKSKPKAASRMRNELAGRPGPLHVDGGFAVGDSSFSRQGSPRSFSGASDGPRHE